MGVSELDASAEEKLTFSDCDSLLLLVMSELLSTFGDVELLESIGVVDDEHELGVPPLPPSDTGLPPVQLLVVDVVESSDSCELTT